MGKRSNVLRRPAFRLLMVFAALFAIAVPFPISPSAAAVEIDVPGVIGLETWAVPGLPNDPNRCFTLHYLEFPDIEGAGVYTAVVFNQVRDENQTFQAGPTFFPGDEHTVSFGIVSHVFRAPAGMHRIILGSDSSGSGCTTSSRFTFVSLKTTVENPPPVASFTWVARTDDPLTVDFDGSSSTDDEGVVSYHWDFGGGANAMGASTAHTFPASGNYSVTLTVADAEGSEDSVTLVVGVDRQDRPPRAVIVVERISPDLRTYTFDAGNSVDPDGDVLTYRWDFGDRTSSTDEFVLHAYRDKPRKYRVTLTVTAKGVSDTASVEVQVGAFAVRGQLFEQVCGNDATRAPVEGWQVRSSGSSFKNKQDALSPYEFFALPNDQVTIRPERAEAHDDTPKERDKWPVWQPVERTVLVVADTMVEDFVHCFGPDAPSLLTVVERNKTYIAESGVTIRSGGTLRVCQKDDFDFQPYALYANSSAVVDFAPVPGTFCKQAVVVNTSSKILHLELFDALHPRQFQDIVILPQ